MSVSTPRIVAHQFNRLLTPFKLQVTNTTSESIAVLGVCVRSTSWEVTQEDDDSSKYVPRSRCSCHDLKNSSG